MSQSKIHPVTIPCTNEKYKGVELLDDIEGVTVVTLVAAEQYIDTCLLVEMKVIFTTGDNT